MPDEQFGNLEDIESFLGSLPQPEPSEQEPFHVEIEDAPPETIGDMLREMPTSTLEDEPFEDATVSIGDGACVVCGAPTFRPPGLTKTGRRKRTPRYCDLHDPKLRVPEKGPKSHGLENQLQRVQEELADDLRLLGVMAGPLLPVTGYYLFDNADAFTTALLKLCKNNQRALRVLHRAASVAPIYEVAKDAAGVFYAVQVDMKKLEPDTVVSQRLGVKRAYDAVYSQEATGDITNTNGSGFQGPPRYAPT